MRFDPAASARANAEYISEQLRIFNDNLELTLGAYNGGEGRMRRTVGDNTSVSFYDPRIYNQRSEEHTSELQSLMRISYAVFCLKKKKHNKKRNNTSNRT